MVKLFAHFLFTVYKKGCILNLAMMRCRRIREAEEERAPRNEIKPHPPFGITMS